jgi:hypothetical protein
MNKLYGRRILHVMSPVRWNATKWLHHGDSNWKVMYKTIKFLPDCHHYVLVPPNNTVEKAIQQDNITWIHFPYPISVLANRGFFNYKALRKFFDWRRHDLDFVFLHQPELFYNVISGLLSDRVGTSVDTFLFFHWVDSPASKPSETYTDGFWRQIEAIDLSAKTFFHCNASLDYIKSNWSTKRQRITGEINDKKIKEKITYMPLAGGFTGTKKKSTPVPLPDKKILLFNHRWNTTTGIKRLIEYTKDLDRDEYLVWVTDEDAKKPRAGQPAPEWMRVQNFPSGEEYQYLVEKSHATLCFVDSYGTWNLSVQDGIALGRPSLTYYHSMMDEVVGEGYPLYFKSKDEFLRKLRAIPDDFSYEWVLPPHEENFRNNLYENMIKSIETYEAKRKQEPHSQDGTRLYGREWLWHILNDNGYKKNILYNTHRDLHLSNSWEHLRKWVLMMGAVDDPNDVDSRLTIPEDKVEEIKKLLNDPKWIDRSFASEPKRDPKFVKVNKNKFF